jgi:hypothetical protein
VTPWRLIGPTAIAQRLKYANVEHVLAFHVHFIEKELVPD